MGIRCVVYRALSPLSKSLTGIHWSEEFNDKCVINSPNLRTSETVQGAEEAQSERSPECVCAVEMGMAVPRTPEPQPTHGDDKAFSPRVKTGGKWQSLRLVCVSADNVCRGYLPYCSFTRCFWPEDCFPQRVLTDIS